MTHTRTSNYMQTNSQQFERGVKLDPNYLFRMFNFSISCFGVFMVFLFQKDIGIEVFKIDNTVTYYLIICGIVIVTMLWLMMSSYFDPRFRCGRCIKIMHAWYGRHCFTLAIPTLITGICLSLKVFGGIESKVLYETSVCMKLKIATGSCFGTAAGLGVECYLHYLDNQSLWRNFQRSFCLINMSTSSTSNHIEHISHWD